MARPFCRIHQGVLEGSSRHNLNERQQKSFPQWFDAYISNQRHIGAIDPASGLVSLAYGPQKIATEFSGCVVNDVRFLIESRDVARLTQNCGISVPGEQGGTTTDFYGVLQGVLELSYRPQRRVVLFVCKWYDTNIRKRRIHFHRHLTSINVLRTWYSKDPYIFCTQARLVMYMNDPNLGHGWKAVEKMPRRGLWDVQEKGSDANIDETEHIDEPEQIFHMGAEDQVDSIQLTRQQEEDEEILSHQLQELMGNEESDEEKSSDYESDKQLSADEDDEDPDV